MRQRRIFSKRQPRRLPWVLAAAIVVAVTGLVAIGQGHADTATRSTHLAESCAWCSPGPQAN